MENLKELKDKLDEAMDDFNKTINEVFGDYEPEFKVGQWVVTASCNEVKRIKEINGDIIKYDDGCTHTSWKGFIRLATPAKIESHLKKICDEKYIGKRVKCLFDGEYIVSSFWIYDVKGDKLWYNIRGANTCILLYEEGKFAEIIPDKKKKPETREEFEEFMDDWLSDENEKRNEFLDQYDI